MLRNTKERIYITSTPSLNLIRIIHIVKNGSYCSDKVFRFYFFGHCSQGFFSNDRIVVEKPNKISFHIKCSSNTGIASASKTSIPVINYNFYVRYGFLNFFYRIIRGSVVNNYYEIIFIIQRT